MTDLNRKVMGIEDSTEEPEQPPEETPEPTPEPTTPTEPAESKK